MLTLQLHVHLQPSKAALREANRISNWKARHLLKLAAKIPEANYGAIDVEGLRGGRFRAKDIMIPVHATLKCINRGSLLQRGWQQSMPLRLAKVGLASPGAPLRRQ